MRRPKQTILNENFYNVCSTIVGLTRCIKDPDMFGLSKCKRNVTKELSGKDSVIDIAEGGALMLGFTPTISEK